MSKAKKLFENLTGGREIYKQFGELLKTQYTINEKTIDEWWAHFGIMEKDENLTPARCKELDAEIARLFQEASYYLSSAAAEMQLLEKSSETTYREQYTALVTESTNKNDKIPAAATLDTLAKAGQDDVYSAVANAKTAREFWKTILVSLDTCRKLVDNATYNLNIEAKLLGKEREDE